MPNSSRVFYSSRQKTLYLKALLTTLAVALSVNVAEADYARPHSTELTIRGLSDISETATRAQAAITTEHAPAKQQIAPVSIVGIIKGIGRIDVRLNVKRNVAGLSSRATFYQGSIALGGGLRRRNNSRVVPAAVSIIDNMLTLNFLGRASLSTGKPRLYAVRARLSNVERVKARVASPSSAAAGARSCETSHDEAEGHKVFTNARASDSPHSTKSAQEGIFKIITISTDADEQWYQRYGENSNAEIARILNAAEAMYLSIVGIGVSIKAQHVYQSSSPYTSTSAGGLLNQFVTNPDNITNLASNSDEYFSVVDAKHLFSGKSFDGSAIGIAYVGTICSYSSLSFGVSQAMPNDLTIAVFAHELSHNLGAYHDVNSPNTLMYPSVNLSAPVGYSARSLNEINQYLSVNSACLGEETRQLPEVPTQPSPLPAPEPSPPSEDDPDDGGEDLWELRIRGKRLASPTRSNGLVRGLLIDTAGKGVSGVGVQLYQRKRLIESGQTDEDGKVFFAIPTRRIPRQGTVFQLRTSDGAYISGVLRVPPRRGNTP